MMKWWRWTWGLNREKRRPVGAAKGSGGMRESTTSKRIVWLCLGNGIAWVWCSYLLAYLGREEIAESLSEKAVAEIVGVVLVYALKSLFENLSKNNQWPDKPNAGRDA